jgi:hypothetical protein
MHIGGRSRQGKEDQKEKIAAQRSKYTRPVDGKWKSNPKAKEKGREAKHTTCWEGEGHGSCGSINRWRNGNQIRKQKKGEGKHNIPHAGKGTATGPAAASTDGDVGDDGAHEQDANAESEQREGRLQASGLI